MLKPQTLVIGWLIAMCSMSYPANFAMSSDAVVTNTSVCQLYASRLTPEKKDIRVRATAWVALRHGGVLLIDPQCPKITVGFRFSDEAMTRPKVKAFNRAMIGNPMDLKMRIFEVQMVGMFLGPTDAEPDGLLNVENVEWFRQRQ